MPRLSKETWETIRAERETGVSFPELAAKHGVSYQAIQKRAKKAGWANGENIQEVVRRKAAEKIAGFVVSCNPEKKAQAIDAAAEKVAAVVDRHRQEWVQVATLRQEALRDRETNLPGAFNRAKLAKITAEMTAIQQAGERKAWGLDKNDGEHTITIERAYG